MMRIQFFKAERPFGLTRRFCARGLAAAVFVLMLSLSLAANMARAADVRVAFPAHCDLATMQSDASLHSVRFFDSRVGVAVGDLGAVWYTDDGGATWAAGNSGLACRIEDVIWTGPQTAVAVGGGYDRITRTSRGAVIRSRDGGRTWSRADDVDLPRLRKLELAGENVLRVDGDWSHPSLSNRFESRDGGRTWTAGQPAPPGETVADDVADLLSWAGAMSTAVTIRDARTIVADDSRPHSRLCAVGDHGVILTSDDRGQTWTPRRGDQRRAAVLVVAKNPASVAWSIVGAETLDAGNRVAVLVDSFDTSDDPAARSVSIGVAQQVAATIGASGLDAIGDANRRDEAATQWLMVTRPATLLLDQRLPQSTRDAFFRAAIATGVGRIASYVAKSDSAAGHRDALLTQAGVLASDLQSDAMHWIAPLQLDARSTSMEYLYDVSPSRRSGESITSGLSLHVGRKRTPNPGSASRRQLQVVQARLNQSARIEQLLSSSRTPVQLATSFDAMLDQTARPDQFRLAWSVYAQTLSMESVPITHQTTVLDRIADRFADETAGKYAKLRRDSIRQSVEWQRIDSGAIAKSLFIEMPPPRSVAVSPFQIESSVQSATPTASGMGQVRQVSAIAPLLVPKPENLVSPSQVVAPERGAVDLTWEFHPLVLLGMEAAARSGKEDVLRQGAIDANRRRPASLKQLSQTTGHPWSTLVRETGRQTLHANRADRMPHLDGLLDDVCWQSSNVITHIALPLRIAYDADYVYVAVVCPADAIDRDTVDDGSATRDQDLSGVDRLRLCFDIDRDLLTSMQLQVTDARRTHDAIDGNSAWQPTWYVAVNRTPASVTYEIAILRRDLMDPSTVLDDPPVWFVKADVLSAGESADTQVIPTPNRWTRVAF